MSDYFEEQNKAVDAQEVTTTKSPQDEDGSDKSFSEQSTNGSGESLNQAENQPEGAGDKPAEDKQQEQQKLYTKDEFDASAAKIKAIYEKKGRKAAERELAERFADQPQPPTVQVQSQAPNVPPPPDNNSFWDPTLNQWLPNDITVTQYVSLANQVLPAQQEQPAQQPVNQPQVQQNPNPQPAKPQFSEQAENQGIECEVELKDFTSVMKGAPITPTMANAACLDPNGMKNLYEMMKEAPHELYQISQINDPIEQQNRMWLMNQKFAQKRSKKVQTRATEQPAPLEANGKINKPWSEMSYLEKKKARENEIWR
jgi:hypothetical protein